MKNNIFLFIVIISITACGTDKPFARGPEAASPGGRLNTPNAQAIGSPQGKDFFVKEVHPLLVQNCITCHSGGMSHFTVTQDAVADYAVAIKLIVPKDTAHSRLYQKPIGNMGHGGGKIWEESSQEVLHLATWINGETP